MKSLKKLNILKKIYKEIPTGIQLTKVLLFNFKVKPKYAILMGFFSEEDRELLDANIEKLY